MTPSQAAVDRAEATVRTDTGLIWDSHDGRPVANPVGTAVLPLAYDDADDRGNEPCTAIDMPARRTDGAAYAHDGTLEGMLCAVRAAIRNHDAHADVVARDELQPRLGQEVIPVDTCMPHALQMRRLVEYALGTQAFHCIRTAAASQGPDTGTRIHRFLAYAIPASGRTGCSRCARKGECTNACERPRSCPLLDDVSVPAVFGLIELYRTVMNERHLMLQFMRFEHREGDVWFARCNPKASVVPLLMDWFAARFNDQRFVIYDENHGISGVYDGSGWFLVGGDAPTPPPESADEQMMRAAWKRFYTSLSVEARYHPELRRNFMPMRLWRNLPEMSPAGK